MTTTKKPVLIIRFNDEDGLKDWADAAFAVGMLPDGAGVRQCDAMDMMAGRAREGEFLVTKEPGIGGVWIVPPQGVSV